MKKQKLLISKLKKKRKELILQKNWPAVLFIINSLIEIRPSAKRFSKKAVLLLKMGFIEKALESYQEAILLDRKCQVAVTGVQKASLLLQELEHLVDSLRWASEQEKIRTLRKKAVEATLVENWNKVISIYETWLKLEPTALRYCNKALAHCKLQQWSEALKCFSAALEREPDYEIANVGITKVKSKLSNILEKKETLITSETVVDTRVKSLWQEVISSQTNNSTLDCATSHLTTENIPEIKISYPKSAYFESFSGDETIVDGDPTSALLEEDPLEKEEVSSLELALADSETVIASKLTSEETLMAQGQTFSGLETLNMFSEQTLLKNYKIIENISSDEKILFLRAIQNNLKRDVLLKKLIANSEKEKQKLISEALLTAYLDHPNIFSTYDIGEEKEEGVFVVTKLIDGAQWKNLISPVTPDEKILSSKYTTKDHLHILLHVCNAIAFAHSKGIVHNDLKPENVIVGNYGEVVVTNWCVAVDVRTNPVDLRTRHKSSINHLIGTPGYMSPELVMGNGNKISYCSDVYSLGVILNEIITKKPLHTGETLEEILLSTYNGKIMPLDENTPNGIKAIRNKALQRDVSQRYQTVEAFKKELQQAI